MHKCTWGYTSYRIRTENEKIRYKIDFRSINLKIWIIDNLCIFLFVSGEYLIETSRLSDDYASNCEYKNIELNFEIRRLIESVYVDV